MQLTRAVLVIALTGTASALPSVLKTAESKPAANGEKSTRVPAYTAKMPMNERDNVHQAERHANAGSLIAASQQAEGSSAGETLQWQDLEREQRLADRSIRTTQIQAEGADPAKSWENKADFAAQAQEQTFIASQKQQQGQKSGMSSVDSSFDEQRQASAPAVQQRAIQGIAMTQTERYNEQADQTKYNDNVRQQLNAMNKVTARSPVPQDRVAPHVWQTSNLAAEQSLGWQQQSQAQQRGQQHTGAQQNWQQAEAEQFNHQLWQQQQEESNIASDSFGSANTRARLQSRRHEQSQSQRLGLEKQQLQQRSQAQQQIQQVEQTQQAQQAEQTQAETELMACLRAALGNLHQETLCLASRYYTPSNVFN